MQYKTICNTYEEGVLCKPGCKIQRNFNVFAPISDGRLEKLG
ncbi:hypothetical protein SB6424_01477 [Klebsiella pasteurii]|uniref:Uncharacterized protein n=1 Tax=Klebsiella pasteurii TaxID=2587529 RepID=A0A9Q9SBS3_9ENTR|nr:hypothetical protein HMPREF9694_00818 [Klebsiella michiganensis]VUS24698.1 hypothetical protein SB6420_00022 [Klebsiella pasteurii]VUS43101.1 hypothetical protein SB6423_04703 [Klebsiella pasteurii]VUS44419.1 hypothetical protein SB6417_01452 [Klebsiella pasteurii]VUS44437.1 hypothetical protein SB6412_01701 [Klebsiella pasteurii]